MRRLLLYVYSLSLVDVWFVPYYVYHCQLTVDEESDDVASTPSKTILTPREDSILQNASAAHIIIIRMGWSAQATT